MRFQCPFCRGIVAVDNSDLGTDVQCGLCNEIVTVPFSRVATGAVIADFIIMQELGRGGMGVVYLAHQMSLDRPAALKILSENYANNAEFVVGFIKEARAAARLNHPHIVQAYAVGEDEGIFYFAMENIDGETMKQVLKREHKIPCDQALSIIQQIAEALDYAWKEQRLIHRDIKPDNIMLTSNGRAKLADLGLARVAGDIDDSEEDEVMGTPQYISPEHLTGAPMDVRSDIYSLGATFYHFVTGRFPFEGRNGTEIAKKHLVEPLVPPNRIDKTIPENVSRIIEKMMAKNPKHRYQDAEELVDDLRLARRGKPLASMPMTASAKNIPVPPGVRQKTRQVLKTSTSLRPKTIMAESRKSHPSGVFSVPTTTGPIGQSTTTTTLTNRTDIYNLKRMHEEQLRKRLIVVGICCALVILSLLVGIIAMSSSKTKKKAPVPGATAQVTNSGPKTTPYTMKAEKILDYAKNNPTAKNEFHRQCEDLVANFQAPKYPVEQKRYLELMELFVPIDEAMIANARESALKKYQQELQAQEERRKQEAERKKQEEERRRQEEERRKQEFERRKQEERERAAKMKEDAEIFRQEADKERNLSIKRVLDLGMKSDFAGAKAVLDVLQKYADGAKEQKYVSVKGALSEIAAWLNQMRQIIDTADKTYQAYLNGSSGLSGSTLEYKNDLYKIKEIKNGALVLEGSSRIRTTVKLDQLLPRQKNALLRKVMGIAGIEAMQFSYALLTGDFVSAKALSGDDFWKNEISKIEYQYFFQTLKSGTALEKSHIASEYGKQKEYKLAEDEVKKLSE